MIGSNDSSSIEEIELEIAEKGYELAAAEQKVQGVEGDIKLLSTLLTQKRQKR